MSRDYKYERNQISSFLMELSLFLSLTSLQIQTVTQSLVLVVSTPAMAKGQKRKSKGDSRKKKGKGKGKGKKKGESTSIPVLQRNVLYFDEDKSQERYNVDFSLWKVSNGRWVDYNFFDSHNF